MKKRVVALFLTAALATAMLAGCGSSSEAAAAMRRRSPRARACGSGRRDGSGD